MSAISHDAGDEPSDVAILDPVKPKGPQWARAQGLATEFDVSRPLIYKLVRRFKIPSVSLAEGSGPGVRLFRRDLFAKAIADLAAEQAGKPFPHNRGHKTIAKQRSKKQPVKG